MAVWLLGVAPRPANAQDTVQPPPAPADTAVLLPGQPAADSEPRVRLDVKASEDTTLASLKPPLTPMGAFWRSTLIPGWGQAKFNRKLAAGGFIAAEGLMLGMVFKTNMEVQYANRIQDTSLVSSKEGERQDWLILLAFNHLLAGLEALVSAHLWDFPKDLKLRAVPSGVGGSVRFRVRTP